MKRAKETLVIQSPEQVGFHLKLAGLGTRTAAFLLDTLFRWVAVLFVIVAVILAVRWIPALDPLGFLADLSRTWILALGFTVYGVMELGYFILFEALWNGQTPGKRIQGIRVVRSNGEPIGWTESAVRNVLRAADILGGFYPLGLLVIFLSPKSQRIGDYAAGTVVVIEKRGAVPVKLDQPDSPGDAPVQGLEFQVSFMTAQDYRIIRSFLNRREGMDRAHRQQIARKLGHRLMEQWKVPRRSDLTYEAFLEAVASEYERTRRAI
jgi:uncharacterized RDD family membrane protein YckC